MRPSDGLLDAESAAELLGVRPSTEFFTVTHIGTGAMFINRRVWEKIPGPWFKWCQLDDELRTTDGNLSEDCLFASWLGTASPFGHIGGSFAIGKQAK